MICDPTMLDRVLRVSIDRALYFFSISLCSRSALIDAISIVRGDS